MEDIEAAQLKLHRKKKNRAAILVSAAVHLVFVLIAAYIVALHVKNKPQATFYGDPPPRPRLKPDELKMEVKKHDLEKRSAPPRLQPRLLAMSPTDLALPEIKPDPKADDKKVRRSVTTLGMSGIGSGIGGGYGTGSGGGTSFFGLRTTGRRIAYLVDYSLSLKGGGKHEIMRRELAKSIDMLPSGSQVCLIFFSGPTWFCGQNATALHKNWSRNRSGWVCRSGLPRPQWLKIDPANAVYLKMQIQSTQLTLGTDWMPPFKVMMKLSPPPDTIYFMTDGVPQVSNERAVMAAVRKWNDKQTRRIPINAIALKAPGSAGRYMKQLARDSRGQFKIVN